MKAEITLLPGDGIGPEVLAASKNVMVAVAETFGHDFEMHEFLIGGCAIDEIVKSRLSIRKTLLILIISKIDV